MGHEALEASRESKASTGRKVRVRVLGKEGPGVDRYPRCLRCDSAQVIVLSHLEDSCADSGNNSH